EEGPMNADRAETQLTLLTQLDDRDHRRAAAAFGVPQPRPGGADRCREWQLAQAARAPVRLNDCALGRHRFVTPEIQCSSNALFPVGAVGLAVPFDLDGVDNGR